jgi:hypothetical protein
MSLSATTTLTGVDAHSGGAAPSAGFQDDRLIGRYFLVALVFLIFLTIRTMDVLKEPAIETREDPNRNSPSGQVSVFVFGLDQNWNVRIGIFPDREEVLIRLASFWQIACQRVRAAQA